MKRGILFLFFILIVSTLSSCSWSLSEEELKTRAADYARLVETLQAVGYDNDFEWLNETNSMERNLRILWMEYFSSYNDMEEDARKNIEMLLSLGNFDFIAEGLQSEASSENPYYNDWPRDSQYTTASRTVSFSNDEVLWLMLLLPDSDFPEAHLGLKEVLAACGEEVLQGYSGEGTGEGIWFYYEKTYPGLLENVYPDFMEYFSDEIKTAFQNADDDIQSRFMQVIDVENFRNLSYRDSPARVFSPDEAEELMREYPPAGSWEGGYIRVIDDPTFREGAGWIGQDTSDYNINRWAVDAAYIYTGESGALVPVIHPADARFAVYEEYTAGEYYARYTGDSDFDVCLLNLHIRIVDLVTGEEIFSESVQSNPPPEEIEWYPYSDSGHSIVVDHIYYQNDFDLEKYAAVMEEYCETAAL